MGLFKISTLSNNLIEELVIFGKLMISHANEEIIKETNITIADSAL